MRARLLPIFLCIAGCEGSVIAPTGGGGINALSEVSASGIRRLSRVEMDDTLADLLADHSAAAETYIAPDPTNPFDNDYTQQIASSTLIDELEQIATEAAARLVANPTELAALVPCTPTGPGDAACLSAFIKSFGLKALRRPMTDDDVASYATLQSYAVEANDFNVAVKLVVQAMAQEPEFVYRVEIGDPVAGQAGVFHLNPYQVATRLSYFLWGSMPPDWLFASAGDGTLASSDGLGAAAQKLLDDPRARIRVERYHALWLSYFQLPHSADLDTAMQTESSALVDKVIFDDKSDYFDLFRSTSTYINQTLATQYAMDNFTGGSGYAWTDYASVPRRGLLSHGSVLSAGAKFSDTSPTQRGIFIRTRLFCQTIPPPPPGINVDAAPPSTSPSECKIDRYAAHAAGGCASCHHNLDPVGFGIENFDMAGAYRQYDDVPMVNTACPIKGDGVLAGPSGDQTFNGVIGLEDLMINGGQMESCISTQVFRFAMGRTETSSDSDRITGWTDTFKKQNRSFQSLLLAVTSDPTFTYRKDE